MRIADVRVFTLRIPLDRPVLVGGGLRISEREYVLVALDTDDGRTGVGWGYTRGGDLAGVVRRNLRPLLEGEDALATTRLWDKMYQALRSIGRGGMVMRSLSVVDIALWDLKGQAAGLPLHRLIGGYASDAPVLVAGLYYTEGRSPDDDAREAAAYVEDGFDAIKLMGGAAVFDVDLERVRAVRRAVGDSVRLALDVNGAWQEPQIAVTYARALADAGVVFVEEPMPAEHLPGLKALASASPVPIASGETESGRRAFRELLEAGVDILRPDATVAGGISEWLNVHAMAAAWGRTVIPHDFPYIHVHMAAGLAGVERVEWVTTEGGISNFHRVLREPLWPRRGRLAAPEAPGLGVSINWEAVERYAVS